MTMSVVSSVDLDSAPPMTPARPMIFPPVLLTLSTAVGDEEVLGIQGAFDVVEGRELLPRLRTTHDDLFAEQRRVIGVQGLAEFEHDVVRHVDGQADGTHACGNETALHPERGCRLRGQARSPARR